MTPETASLSPPNAHAAAASASQDSTAADTTRAQYLTFELAGQHYGLGILCVQEIRAWEPPTRLPHSPAHVLGVINLRGAVVPILDLRRRFGLSVSDQSRAPVIIVVNTPTPRGHVTSGLLIDAVCDVCEIAAASIQPAPHVGTGLDRDVMRGLCTLQGRMLILLEPERLLRHIATESEATHLAADKTGTWPTPAPAPDGP